MLQKETRVYYWRNPQSKPRRQVNTSIGGNRYCEFYKVVEVSAQRCWIRERCSRETSIKYQPVGIQEESEARHFFITRNCPRGEARSTVARGNSLMGVYLQEQICQVPRHAMPLRSMPICLMEGRCILPLISAIRRVIICYQDWLRQGAPQSAPFSRHP